MLKNIKFRKFVRVILAFFSTCFLVLMGWILVDCFTAKSTATEKVITYKLEDNIDYEVTLKDNQFYTSALLNFKIKSSIKMPIAVYYTIVYFFISIGYFFSRYSRINSKGFQIFGCYSSCRQNCSLAHLH